MQLTQADLEEFKTIYRAECGEEITDAQARELGTRLVRVFQILWEVSEEQCRRASPSDRP